MEIKRVLIIEDDSAQSQALSKLLQRRNLQTSCAESLAEGLACVRAGQYSCIVLDLGLPDSDSMQTAKSIPSFGDTPVVALTGHDDRELLREVRSHGAQYVLKSVDTPALMEKVLMAIELHEPDREIEEGIIEEQRSYGGSLSPVRWYERVSAVIAFAIMVLTATATAGAYLYRAVADKATDTEQNKTHFVTLDKSVEQFQGSMERFAATQTDLQMKAQTSVDDRAGIHRELGALLNQQQELKQDVVRRLERIEDGQKELLKEFSKRQ